MIVLCTRGALLTDLKIAGQLLRIVTAHLGLLPGSRAAQTLGRFFRLAEARPSFPSTYPLLALDRMMLSPHGELLDVSTHDSPLSRRASDHLPIKARLRLDSSSGAILR